MVDKKDMTEEEIKLNYITPQPPRNLGRKLTEIV